MHCTVQNACLSDCLRVFLHALQTLLCQRWSSSSNVQQVKWTELSSGQRRFCSTKRDVVDSCAAAVHVHRWRRRRRRRRRRRIQSLACQRCRDVCRLWIHADDQHVDRCYTCKIKHFTTFHVHGIATRGSRRKCFILHVTTRSQLISICTQILYHITVSIT